jgi:hypothetical protein
MTPKKISRKKLAALRAGNLRPQRLEIVGVDPVWIIDLVVL